MMAYLVCELFTLTPGFLYMTAGLEGKTLTAKKKKKEKEMQHKSPKEVGLDCNEKKE